MSSDNQTLDSSDAINRVMILQSERMNSMKGTLANFRMDSGKPNVKKSRAYYEKRLEKIELLYKEFQDDHKVLLFSADTDHEYFTNDTASLFDEAYLEVYCTIVDDRDTVLGTPSTSSTSKSNSNAPSTVNRPSLQYLPSVQVPHIPISPFSGRIIDWIPFHDSFVRLVHANAPLDPMQKFHILKESLPKDRDQDIHAMLLTEENYKSAWQLLIKRYENKRVLFMAFMNSLYGIPHHDADTSDNLKALLSSVNVFINGLRRWKVPIDACDHWLVHYLTTKLSKSTHQKWESYLGKSAEIPNFKDFEEFLNGHIIELDAIENRHIGNPVYHPYKQTNKPHNSNSNQFNDKRFSSSNKSFKADKRSVHALTKSSNSQGNVKCDDCGSNTHSIQKCTSFLAKDCFARKNVAEKVKLCFNCLGKSHSISQCTSKKNCGICGNRHHTMLHFPTIANTTQSAQPSTASSIPHTSNASQTPQHVVNTHTTRIISTASIQKSPKVLLSTALVKMANPTTGREIMVRAFFDGGSEGTAVSEHIVQSLGLQRKTYHTDILGVGDSKQFSSEAVGFALRSCLEPDFSVYIDTALVLSTVTAHLPTKRVIPQNWAHIHGLTLADPSYYQPGKIDLLIGSEMSAYILYPEMRIGLPSEPIAQNSHFGWMLSGQTGIAPPTRQIRCHHTSIQTNELESLVRGFFDCEQIPE